MQEELLPVGLGEQSKEPGTIKTWSFEENLRPLGDGALTV